jgi:hypothetical protein
MGSRNREGKVDPFRRLDLTLVFIVEVYLVPSFCSFILFYLYMYLYPQYQIIH